MSKLSILPIVFLLNSCTSYVSLIEKENYARIDFQGFKATTDCSGRWVELDAIKQPNAKPIYIKGKTVYLPQGENFLYFKDKREQLGYDGKCGIFKIVGVHHFIGPKFYRGEGVELKVNLEAGKSYLLYHQGEKVEFKKIELVK